MATLFFISLFIYVTLAFVATQSDTIKEFFSYINNLLLSTIVGLGVGYLFETIFVNKIVSEIKGYSGFLEWGVKKITLIESYYMFIKKKLNKRSDSIGGEIKILNSKLEEFNDIVDLFPEDSRWKLKLILMHPDNEMFYLRKKEIEFSHERILADQRYYIYENYKEVIKNRNNIEVRFFRDEMPSPPMIIFKPENKRAEVYTSINANIRSRKLPYICWLDCITAECVEEYFDEKWERIKQESDYIKWKRINTGRLLPDHSKGDSSKN